MRHVQDRWENFGDVVKEKVEGRRNSNSIGGFKIYRVIQRGVNIVGCKRHTTLIKDDISGE